MEILNGKNIHLRAIEPNDIDIIHKWENNSDIWHLSNTIVPFSKYIIHQFIENSHHDIFQNKQLRLMIDRVDKGKNETIGTIDLFDFDPLHKRAGIGILIANNKDRGKGYASEALDILINYCFSILQLNQLYCNITTDNKQSIKLFENKDFELVGIKKDWLLFAGEKKDEAMYQLLNSKCIKKKK
ncbi:MAG: GNAT family N-acetyltransferase [Bacteroidales bacterium]|nr:GNAT family N-acetyltransferase [Bacteroidales bacterium]